MRCILKLVFPLLGVVILCIHFASGNTVEEELTLTPTQKRALERLKEKVLDKLPEDYMKEDLYLNRFLRAKYYDVNNAEQFILDNLKWRVSNNMSTILEEDFSDVEPEHRIYMESFDLEGRPVLAFDAGEWDLRRSIAAGKMKRVIRWVERSIELAFKKVREIRKSGKKDVTQLVIIVNLHNYNVLQHGCLQCIPMYVHLTNVYEKYFPGIVARVFMVNTPPVFESVLSVIRPLMSARTRELLKVYGYDKAQWQEEIFKFISPAELPPEYGGKKVYAGRE